jgi:pimeloyl-ACP methyl ester carboxylesterase
MPDQAEPAPEPKKLVSVLIDRLAPERGTAVSRETAFGTDTRDAAIATRGVVVVAHGGRSVSTEPVTAVQPAVLRMIPVARAIRGALHGTGVVVLRPRFQVRGWNGDEASPLHDLTEVLDDVSLRFGQAPVVLIGHSMGGRAAIRAAGHPAVVAVAGLAPWLPPGEPVSQLAGRRVLLVHGSADKLTRPADTWAYAERARSVGQVAAIEVLDGEHAMLRRAHLWHRIAAEFTLVSLALSAGEAESTVARAFREAATGSHRAVL